MTDLPTEGEIRARLQWAALYARLQRERRQTAAARAGAWALAIAFAAALGFIAAKAPGVCAATILQAEERGAESW
ncbi:hypothetical protein NX862_18970 [Rhodobacter sp. KR11]|uniref:hypothetical protein n=1 Tax=Rhodobacter sp. KR11 TaxID=2974588 RepID=UPI002223D5C5|nr:hypothetical protein [Rhodobacter sp. KR11]MCW1920846.1 hypothetical protein [Rhodobacter sp. KR11]